MPDRALVREILRQMLEAIGRIEQGHGDQRHFTGVRQVEAQRGHAGEIGFAVLVQGEIDARRGEAAQDIAQGGVGAQVAPPQRGSHESCGARRFAGRGLEPRLFAQAYAPDVQFPSLQRHSLSPWSARDAPYRFLLGAWIPRPDR